VSGSTDLDRHGDRPARGYSWAPFENGNAVALRHGAYSPRRVEPLAQELVDQVLSDPGTSYLTASRWRAAVWSWARCEARCQLLSEYLMDHADPAGLDAEGNISPALRALSKFESAALAHRARLGLDPLSAARLGRDTAAAGVDLAKLLSEVDDDGKPAAVAAVERLTGLSADSGTGRGSDAATGLSDGSAEVGGDGPV
jgi:hypothetical protein